MSDGKGKKSRSSQKDGLFDDLEGLSDSEIEESLSALKASVEAAIKDQKRVKQERDAEIKLVQDGEQLPEEMEDFEINDECVVFAAPPPSE